MKTRSLLLALIVLGGVLHLVNCTTGQRRDARTALQAIDLVCDAVELVPGESGVELVCDLTDDVRDAAQDLLKPKKRKKPKAPKPAASSDGGSP
jgi:hypothetical protein